MCGDPLLKSDYYAGRRRLYCSNRCKEVCSEFAQVFLERHNYLLPEQKPAENLNNGQITSPYQNWREQYQHTVCIAGAIRAQLDGKTYRQAALDIGRNPNTFPRYMKRAARMLSAAYV